MNRRDQFLRLVTGIGAVLSLIFSVFWFVAEGGYEPFITGIGSLIAFAVYFLSKPETPERAKERQDRYQQRNRENLLEQIRVQQVESVLEASLHDAIVAELNLTHTPILQHTRTLQQDKTSEKTLGSYNDDDIFQLFQDDKTARRLMILGEPGAGKTTTMLRLARELVKDAQNDDSKSIPVIFQLSAWAEKRDPIREWMVNELVKKYRVSDEDLARQWVADDEILPLFDGLDEVAFQHRKTCIEAINDYQSQNTFFFICSRIIEWEELQSDKETTPLNVNALVRLQALSDTQIEDYLQTLGDEVSSLRRVLSADEQLQEMATSPLLLNMMVLAYRGMDINPSEKFASIDERRKHLFKTYIERRFSSDGVVESYQTNKQTQTWLGWLARQMSERDQRVFPDRRVTSNMAG